MKLPISDRFFQVDEFILREEVENILADVVESIYRVYEEFPQGDRINVDHKEDLLIELDGCIKRLRSVRNVVNSIPLISKS